MGSIDGSENPADPAITPAHLRTQLASIYDDLRALARARMAEEKVSHTLEATALVHEAYARLAEVDRMSWRDRGHLYAAAAETMRRVLVDHARAANRDKRGGGWVRCTLGAAEEEHVVEPDRMLDLDAALTALAEEDPRAAEVTRLRYFAGLPLEEIAAALDLSVRTVTREWSYAKARLTELLGDDSRA